MDVTLQRGTLSQERPAFDQVSAGVQAIIDRIGAADRPLRVLEAGCGSRSHIQLRQNAYVVGMDISPEQLERNEDLNEKIVGDIQTFPLPYASFDIIFCWDVLEHLEHPELAIQNFGRAVRADGVIVLGAPLANSLKGAVTRFTPLWFHVWVFRRLLGNKVAGTTGHGPFPTFFKKAMSPSAIEQFAGEEHLQVETLALYKDAMESRLRKKHWTIDLAFRVGRPVLRVLSLGRINPNVTDFVIVLRRLAAGSTASAVSGTMAHV